tara:strand:- start:105 stop:290 length:186 start_codon:yes stop_codon:yes gene_type:complete
MKMIDSIFDKLDQMKNLQFQKGNISNNPELYILISNVKIDFDNTLDLMIEIIIELSKRNSD